jgi:CarD family transcriptional regulator
MKASGRVASQARTTKAASVAVSRVQGDKVAKPSPAKPAAKAETSVAAKVAPKPATKVAPPAATRPVVKIVSGSPAATASKPAGVVTPDVAAKPQPAKAVPAPAAPSSLAPAPAPRPAVPTSMPPPGHGDRRPGPLDRNPPRAPSKAEIFIEGDYVVYPTHGVGKVERIATEEIAGHRLELIHITFEENRMTLRVPVAKARTAGLRKLATRKLFDEAMAVLKGRARIKRTMWSRRAQEYEAKINSGDPLAIAEVVRDLHRNAGQPDQSFSERQIYEAAMDRLAAELAALDKTDKPTAVTKLGDFLKTV